MITFKEFLGEEGDLLIESINDKGLFKALFVVGFTGAGKSYTVDQLGKPLQLSFSPQIVNIDIANEYIRKAADKKWERGEIEDLEALKKAKSWDAMGETVKRLTRSRLSHHLAGMLPLFVDGTMANPDQVLRRAKILKELGYDVGLLFLHCSPETAKARVKKRESKPGFDRPVDISIIDQQVEMLPKAKEKLNSSNFDWYREFNTDETEFSTEELARIARAVRIFFSAPVENDKGKQIIDDLESLEARVTQQKYMVPRHITRGEIAGMVYDWFPKSSRKKRDQ